MEGFVSLGEEVENEIIIKKSRFICALVPVQTQEQAMEELAKIRKKHYNATHNCSAMIIGENGEYLKSSDDGEPQGTAGKPMLEVLKKSETTNILAVVTRYYGGTLLGTGGLVRAYGTSVSQALQSAVLVQNMPADVYTFKIPYSDYGKLCSVAEEFGATLKSEFAEVVLIEARLKKSERNRFCKRLEQAFLGAEVWQISGECLLKNIIIR